MAVIVFWGRPLAVVQASRLYWVTALRGSSPAPGEGAAEKIRNKDRKTHNRHRSAVIAGSRGLYAGGLRHVRDSRARKPPRQPRLDAREAFPRRPQVHGQGDEVVDLGNGAAVHRQVDRLDVMPARVAGLDPHRWMGVAREGRQPGRVRLRADRTADPVEGPLSSTEATTQQAASAFAIAVGAPGRDPRCASTEGAAAGPAG